MPFTSLIIIFLFTLGFSQGQSVCTASNTITVANDTLYTIPSSYEDMISACSNSYQPYKFGAIYEGYAPNYLVICIEDIPNLWGYLFNCSGGCDRLIFGKSSVDCGGEMRCYIQYVSGNYRYLAYSNGDTTGTVQFGIDKCPGRIPAIAPICNSTAPLKEPNVSYSTALETGYKTGCGLTPINESMMRSVLRGSAFGKVYVCDIDMKTSLESAFSIVGHICNPGFECVDYIPETDFGGSPCGIHECYVMESYGDFTIEITSNKALTWAYEIDNCPSIINSIDPICDSTTETLLPNELYYTDIPPSDSKTGCGYGGLDLAWTSLGYINSTGSEQLIICNAKIGEDFLPISYACSKPNDICAYWSSFYYDCGDYSCYALSTYQDYYQLMQVISYTGNSSWVYSLDDCPSILDYTELNTTMCDNPLLIATEQNTTYELNVSSFATRTGCNLEQKYHANSMYTKVYQSGTLVICGSQEFEARIYSCEDNNCLTDTAYSKYYTCENIQIGECIAFNVTGENVLHVSAEFWIYGFYWAYNFDSCPTTNEFVSTTGSYTTTGNSGHSITDGTTGTIATGSTTGVTSTTGVAGITSDSTSTTGVSGTSGIAETSGTTVATATTGSTGTITDNSGAAEIVSAAVKHTAMSLTVVIVVALLLV